MIDYNNDFLISIEEACDFLHCGRSTIYSLLQKGELEGFRINRRWKIPKESVQKFILSQSHNNTCRCV